MSKITLIGVGSSFPINEKGSFKGPLMGLQVFMLHTLNKISFPWFFHIEFSVFI